MGKAIAGKVGAAVGSVAGGMAGGEIATRGQSPIAEFTEEVLQETKPSLSLGLGADTKEPELPAHYAWEELQALSKLQLDGV